MPEIPIPGLPADIVFGDPESPLPDWREVLPEDDSDDDELTPEEHEAAIAMIGFDPAPSEESNGVKSLLFGPLYQTKALIPPTVQSVVGQPCKQGQSAEKTGCIPAEKKEAQPAQPKPMDMVNTEDKEGAKQVKIGVPKDIFIEVVEEKYPGEGDLAEQYYEAFSDTDWLEFETLEEAIEGFEEFRDSLLEEEALEEEEGPEEKELETEYAVGDKVNTPDGVGKVIEVHTNPLGVIKYLVNLVDSKDTPQGWYSSENLELAVEEEELKEEEELPKEKKPKEAPPVTLVDGVASSQPLPTNNLGIDISQWPTDSEAAKYAAKQINKYEEWAKEGAWSSLDFDASLVQLNLQGNPSDIYRQAVIEAYSKLKAQQAEKLSPKPKTISGWKKLSGAKGSNPGGVYEDESGKKWYVKYPENKKHLKNEFLAAKLYDLAGAKIRNVELVDTPDGLGIAAPYIEELGKFKPNNPSHKQQAAEDFGIHAWLANWDAAGMYFDNLAIAPDGKIMMVDPGGSLTNHAMAIGEDKPFGIVPTEWNTLRDPKKNKNMAEIFGGMTQNQLLAAASKVSAIDSKAIEQLVEKFGPEDPEERDKLLQTLFNRQEWIKDWASTNSDKAKEEPVSKEGFEVGDKVNTPDGPGTISYIGDTGYSVGYSEGRYAGLEKSYKKDEVHAVGEAKLEALKPSKSTVPPAIPPKPIYNTVKNPACQKKFDAIWEAGLTGKVEKVEAITANPDSHQVWVKKAAQYKAAVIQALQAGAKPPESSKAPPSLTTVPKKTEKSKPTPKVDPKKFPEKPTFGSSKKEQNEKNQIDIESMEELAIAGDLEALENFVVPLPSKDTKVKAYKNALIANLKNQLNPPSPPKPYAGALDAVSKVFKGAGDPAAVHAKKIGSFLITEEPGVPDVDFGEKIELETKSYGSKVPYELANTKLAKVHLDARKSITASTKDYLKNYSGSDYKSINNSLRKGKPSPQVKAIAREMIEKAPELPPGTYLSRKKDFNSFSVEDWKALEQSVGKVIQEPGFSSTSVDSKIWQGRVHFNFRTAPGFKALYIAPISSHKNEKEMLLPPGTRYYITKVSKPSSPGGKISIDAILLPTVPGQAGELD